jgi:hypothetical protein
VSHFGTVEAVNPPRFSVAQLLYAGLVGEVRGTGNRDAGRRKLDVLRRDIDELMLELNLLLTTRPDPAERAQVKSH